MSFRFKVGDRICEIGNEEIVYKITRVDRIMNKMKIARLSNEYTSDDIIMHWDIVEAHFDYCKEQKTETEVDELIK